MGKKKPDGLPEEECKQREQKEKAVNKKNGETSGTKIVIDIADWIEQALREEVPPQTIQDVADLVTKFNSRKAGHLTIAYIDLGLSPRDLLPTCKIMLGDGARMRVAHVREALKRRFDVNGREFEVRAMTKVVRVPEQAQQEEDPQGAFDVDVEEIDAEPPVPEDGWVEAGTPESLENARRYLLHKVPGHVIERLKEIKVAGGDPRKALQELISVLWASLNHME